MRDGKRPAVEDLTFTALPGETIAMVGATGAGLDLDETVVRIGRIREHAPEFEVFDHGGNAGQNVVFRLDGRVAHVECPEVVCPVCTRQILPGAQAGRTSPAKGAREARSRATGR